MRLVRTALIGVSIVLLLGVPLSMMVRADAENGYQIVPQSPVSFVTKYYGGATLPTKFVLLDPDGNAVDNATATIWVWWNGLGEPIPGTSSGKSNMGMANNFRYDPDGMQYIYNLNTKPFPAGPGATNVTITIDVTSPVSLEWSTVIHFN